MKSTVFAICALCVINLENIYALERHVFIASNEETWDYAPSGENLVNKNLDSDVFLQQGTNSIGGKYTKALYREYTDANFTKRSSRQEWLGTLGPVIRLNVGDRMFVHFHNNASRPYTIHAHGVIYKKIHEGALYEDNTTYAEKVDDAVLPGTTHIYVWDADQSVAPQEHDPNCLSWAYHSHRDTVVDTNSGLIGMLLVCKTGVIDKDGERTDVDQDFVLLFKVFDENLSAYLDRNIKDYIGNQSGLDVENEEFQESNLMHAINGYVYGNLPGLDVCLNSKISWHLLGMGTEFDMHTVYFHGQTVLYNDHRSDGVTLFPAVFATLIMAPSEPGQWMINCQTHDHYSAGMQAFLNVKSCNRSNTASTLDGVNRHYYIAAEEVQWDYAPSGVNMFEGGKSIVADGSKSKVFFEKSSTRIGGSYKKALYFEYTNSSFISKNVRTSDEVHMGFLGPIIKAEVGDTIKVVFKNKASRNYSIQAQGVSYDKSQEGSQYGDGNGSVQPGSTFTYTWTVPPETGPTDADPDCILYMYTSAVDPVRDTYSGLVGPIVICKKGILDANGNYKNANKDMFLFLSVTDENKSWYLSDNLNGSSVNTGDADFVESNLMHGINGYMYGNQPGLDMCRNERVTWHTLSVGTEVDLHSVYFHGQTFKHWKMTKSSISLIPGQTATITMVPDNAGVWAVVCHTNDHYDAGMVSLFNVSACANPKTPDFNGLVRTYFIAALETEWDFAPSGMDRIYGHPLTEPGSHSEVFTKVSNQTIGKTYKKALYREFTDFTFKTEKTRGSRETHLGMLGPFIKAEVGDVIHVVFKNMASRPYSVHPRGVLYNKGSEGSDYMDGNTMKDSGHVTPGGVYTYTWGVPARSGPGSGDAECVTWAYSSAVDHVKDTNSGLIGPLIICRIGTLDSTLKVRKVQQEFALLFTVTDENESWYLEENKEKYCKKPCMVNNDDEAFHESNLMHGINGYVYNNIPGLDMNTGETVNWYLLGFGTEVDIHTIHYHGQTFIHRSGNNHTGDVISVVPGTFETVVMATDNPGVWLLHCHVEDHLSAGMEATYSVKGAKPALEGPIPTKANDDGTDKRRIRGGLATVDLVTIIALVVGLVVLTVVICVAVYEIRKQRTRKNKKVSKKNGVINQQHDNAAFEL